MWLLLSGERLSAEEALKYGLINEIVSTSELMGEAEKRASIICENGPLAVRAIKELAVKSQYMQLEQGLRMEVMMQSLLKTTEDAVEGPKAFAEKRKPIFQGK
jgi:enoyl-CoA hydratase/carnithine racemase